jgi:hypothetical protein
MMKKQRTDRPTYQKIEEDMEKRLYEMYQSFPDAKTERKVERALARKLGGPLAEKFFADIVSG